MTRWQKTLLVSSAEILTLLIVHLFLLRFMAEHDIASRIFALGQHVPRWMLAVIGCFLLVRFLAVLALPGLIAARLGLVLTDWWFHRMDPTTIPATREEETP